MLTVEGAGLRATVRPERGAKIASLVDRSGREWLAQPAHGGGVEPAPGTAFVDAEMCGWDECAPTIDAGSIDVAGLGSVRLPDHGDLWDAPFSVDPTGARCSADGRSLPYRFSRTIEATDAGLLLHYRAESLRDALPFLWAAHPQFSAPAGTTVRLPPDVDRVIEVSPAPAAERTWGAALSGIDSVPPGHGRKLYLPPHRRAAWAELVRPDGAVLRMSWSDEIAYLGLWFDHGAHSREPVIAIEPTTGFYDSLALAAAAGSVERLEPGVPFEWRLRLEVTG